MMRRRRVCAGLLAWASGRAACAAGAAGDNTASIRSAIERLLGIAGLSARPAQRGAEEAATGSVWVAEVAGGTAARWTAGGGYRSPVFDAPGRAVCALRGDRLLRIDGPGAEPVDIAAANGVARLVGFSAGVPDELVVLTADQPPRLAGLSLHTGRLTPLALDLADRRQQRLLAAAQGDERTAGRLRIAVERQDRQELARVVEWTDVIAYDDPAGTGRNLSRCGGTSCSQPALSPDLRRVVFIRAEP